MKDPQLLRILDEPTNDLDIDTLNVFEEFLANYPGVLITGFLHDGYYLLSIGSPTNCLLWKVNGSVRLFNGNYSSYRYEAELEKQQCKESTRFHRDKKPVLPAQKSKFSFKEQKELETL